MKICGYFWGVITKSDYFFFFFISFFFFLGGGGHFYRALGLLKVKTQNGNNFWAAKLQIFLGMPDIPVVLFFFFFFFFFLGGGGG